MRRLRAGNITEPDEIRRTEQPTEEILFACVQSKGKAEHQAIAQ
jgi:hypothetical protein